MSITWVVQDNLGSTSSTADALKLACLNESQRFEPIQVIPFSHELPDMPNIKGDFVLYGRTTLIINAFSDEKWRKGVFFNPESFTPEQYLKQWGEMMLNCDAQIVLVRDIPSLEYNYDDMLFIRPNDDLKMFTGGEMSFSELLNMHKNCIEDLNEPVNLSTKIVVASSKSIDREWRLFIVDGKFVAGSRYQPDVWSFVPLEVIELAETAASIWTPAPVFVMDIAADYRRLKIIECNCFNGSGFYASDLGAIVRAVSKYVELTQ